MIQVALLYQLYLILLPFFLVPFSSLQNLLIAIQSGISLPFTTFIIHLTIPTLIDLFLKYFILRMYFKKDLLLLNKKTYPKINNGSYTIAATSFNHEAISSIIENPTLPKMSSTILLITIAGFIISEFLHFLHIANVRLSIIALLGAGVLYLVYRVQRSLLSTLN